MNPHVLREPVLAGKAHAALLTGKGLQPQVATHVARHGATLGEHLAADVAGEWTGEPVGLFMLTKSGWIFVALVADRAAKAT